MKERKSKEEEAKDLEKKRLNIKTLTVADLEFYDKDKEKSLKDLYSKMMEKYFLGKNKEIEEMKEKKNK